MLLYYIIIWSVQLQQFSISKTIIIIEERKKFLMKVNSFNYGRILINLFYILCKNRNDALDFDLEVEKFGQLQHLAALF